MVAPAHLLGIALAVGAAVAAAATQLFVRLGTDEGRAADAILVVMYVNTGALVPVVLLWYYPHYGLTAASWLAFAAAGLFGTMLGRLFMFTSIERIGASRTAPLYTAWVLVATVLGVLLLGEEPTPLHAVGIVLIVAGVATIAWETSAENPDDLPRRALLVGLALPFGAAIAYGIEPIFANVGFATGTPAPVGLVIKTLAATLGFTAYLRARGALPGLATVGSADLRWFVLAGLANTLFLLGYYLGLAVAPVSVVTPILATSTLWVVVLSAVAMPERLERVTWQLFAAATVVVVGVIIVTVAG